MKKQLLYTALLFSSVSISQNELNYTNEPAIGDNRTMYEIDPATDALSTTVGNTAVTWDYSQIIGVSTTPRSIQIVDATTTPDASTFPTSVKAFDAGSSLMSYFNSSAASRISQGFIYNEASIGTVTAIFDVNEQTLMTYPFAYGNTFTDNFAGSLSFFFNVQQNTTCTGVSHATIDGEGTLLLPNSTSLSNVLRLKLVDTVRAQVEVIPSIPMDIEFIRTQYEYYNLADGRLPVFTFVNVILQQQGATTPLQETNAVFSSVLPTSFLGIEENTIEGAVVYPNPSEGKITFTGDFSEATNARILDQSGRVVSTINNLMNGQNADLSDLDKGTYLIVISNNGRETTQKVVLK